MHYGNLPIFPPNAYRFKGLGDWTDNMNPFKQVKNVSRAVKEGRWYDAGHYLAGGGSGQAPSVMSGYAKATLNPAKEYVYTRPGTAPKTLLTPTSNVPAPIPEKQKTDNRQRLSLLSRPEGTGAGSSLL